MTDILATLRTPEDIARQITEVTGVSMSPRTVWEKARRLGIGKKLGRSMFISVDDIPALLEPAPSMLEQAVSAHEERSNEEALKKLMRHRKKLKAQKQG